MQNDDQKLVVLETRVAELEKKIVYLIERDNAVRESELALADRGAI